MESAASELCTARVRASYVLARFRAEGSEAGVLRFVVVVLVEEEVARAGFGPIGCEGRLRPCGGGVGWYFAGLIF